MKCTYTLSKQVAPDGMAELLVRFYSGRLCDQQAHSGIRVPVSAWDAHAGALRIPKRNITPEASDIIRRQQQVDALASFLYDEYTRLCGHISTKWLRNTVAAFHGQKSKELHPLADYIIQYAHAKDIAPNTVKRYITLAANIRDFRTLTVEHTTTEDLQSFHDYLRRHGACANTTSSKLKALRAVFNMAVADRIVEGNPFTRFKITAERYGSVVYLTAQERDALYAAPMPTPSMAQQRDIFIFQYHTGCRISDLYSLKAWNITPDGYRWDYNKNGCKNVKITNL